MPCFFAKAVAFVLSRAATACMMTFGLLLAGLMRAIGLQATGRGLRQHGAVDLVKPGTNIERACDSRDLGRAQDAKLQRLAVLGDHGRAHQALVAACATQDGTHDVWSGSDWSQARGIPEYAGLASVVQSGRAS